MLHFNSIYMESVVLEAFAKQSFPVLILGLFLYVGYKMYDKLNSRMLLATDKLTKDNDTLREKFDNYMKQDYVEMKGIMTQAVKAIEHQTTVTTRANDVMGCLIKEIQEFKQGELYQEHENRMTAQRSHKKQHI